MELIYQPTLDTYINIWPQSVSCIPEFSNNFPLNFATNISYPFHIPFKPPFPTQFSRHILSIVFHLSVHTAPVFHNRTCDLFVPSYRLCILYNCLELTLLTQHQFGNMFIVVTRSTHARNTKHSGTEVMTN